MTCVPIVTKAEDVSPAWLTQVLRSDGALHSASVIGVQARPVGNGLIGDSVCFTLSYDHLEAGAPGSVVGKFASRNPPSRQVAAEFGLYQREVTFYQALARDLGMRTPHAYFAQIDPLTQDFTLLMEDLAPARTGDQIVGCSVADCRVAMREAAALHSHRWNDPSLKTTPWLRTREANAARHVAALPQVVEVYRERYASILEPEYMAVVDRFVPVFGRLATDFSGALTIHHGDFRLDNVLFDVRGVAGTMATLDWQTVALGSSLADVSFFIGGALDIEARRAHEEELLRLYLDALHQGGVRDYSWNECWCDYRRFSCRAIFTAAFSPIGFKRGERSDTMFMKMMRHHAQQVIDLDALALWE